MTDLYSIYLKNIYLGDKNVLVKYVQLALNRAGYETPINGEFDSVTCGVLNEFLQSDTECVVDNDVWEKLLPYLRGYTIHTVESGENLWRIANMYDTTVADILQSNPTVDIMNVDEGTNIYVPFSFPVVSDEVPYTYVLTRLVMDGLKVRYPFLATGTIGNSVMGKDVPYMQIGDGDRQLCYNAAFHANEWITTPVLLKFAEEYCKAYVNEELLYEENAQDLYRTYTLYIVPMVNPDGVDLVNGVLHNASYRNNTLKIAQNYPNIPYPSGWKANIDGIDLNLQFPASWQQARQVKFAQGFTSPAPRDFVGDGPLVAPESINMYEFTLAHDFSLILAYHTQGEVIYWKYRDYEPENSRRIAQYFGRVSGYTVEETPYESGAAGYKDWFIEYYNRPGFTIEAGLGENPLDMTQFAQIYEDNKYILVGGMKF